MLSRILVLEPDSAIAELFDTFLTDEGYEVTVDRATFPSPSEIERLDPALILMEFFRGVPRSDAGSRFLDELRLHPATSAVQVIVCTGATPLLDALGDYTNHRPLRVLTKPFTLDELKMALDQTSAAAFGGTPCRGNA